MRFKRSFVDSIPFFVHNLVHGFCLGSTTPRRFYVELLLTSSWSSHLGAGCSFGGIECSPMTPSPKMQKSRRAGNCSQCQRNSLNYNLLISIINLLEEQKTIFNNFDLPLPSDCKKDDELFQAVKTWVVQQEQS